MRIQTIHRNLMGDVFNECSAQGFQITTADGGRITIMVDGDGLARAEPPSAPATAQQQQWQAVADDMGGFSSDTAALAFLRIIGNGNPNVERAVERLRQSLIAQQPAAVEGFDEWYDSVDARFWDNRDACNAAFHAGKRAALAQQPAPSALVGAEDIEVLKRLREALHDAPMNGWWLGVEVLDRVIAALAARPGGSDNG